MDNKKILDDIERMCNKIMKVDPVGFEPDEKTKSDALKLGQRIKERFSFPNCPNIVRLQDGRDYRLQVSTDESTHEKLVVSMIPLEYHVTVEVSN